MSEKRVIIGHAPHVAQGPHFEASAGFVPLRFRLESEDAWIDVTCPVAIIGRHTEADLRFAFSDISRRHCRLAYESGQWRVYDLNSLNHVFVNNAAVTEATLYTGDLLRIGCVELLVTEGTPVRLTKMQEAQNAKLRQIADVFPPDMDRQVTLEK